MSRGSRKPHEPSAVSQINQLKPIPGLDDTLDTTQRPADDGPESARKTAPSIMKDVVVEEKTQRQDQRSRMMDPETRNATSQMGSIMKGSSTMGSVISPVNFNQQQSSDCETVFVQTNAISRPAIVREPNNWMKRQTVDMNRRLPLGAQPGDVSAVKINSHTGVTTETPNAKTTVTNAPASSPTPLQPLIKSNESSEPSAEKIGQPQQKARQRRSSNQPNHRNKASAPPVLAKSCPATRESSPNAAAVPASKSQPSVKESAFMKFAKSFLPSSSPAPSSNPPSIHQKEVPKRNKFSTTIYEKRKRSKQSNKESHK